MSEELLVQLGRELRKRMSATRREALERGVDFRPVGAADGISVGDVVSIGDAHSRYEVRRIDPQLSDPLDAASELVFFAGLRALTGPFEGRYRRIRTSSLRRAS
jgi:hypothetical protein